MRILPVNPRIELTTPAEEPDTLPPSPLFDGPLLPFPLRTAAETALQLLIHALAMLGWREGVPPWAPEAGMIDQQVVARTRCLECKKRSLRYHAWHRPHRGYLAVTICKACGHVEEI